jgi:hypothetical protein
VDIVEDTLHAFNDNASNIMLVALSIVKVTCNYMEYQIGILML